MKNYDIEFNTTVSNILDDLYNKPDMNMVGGVKRKKFVTQKKYIDYLVKNEFVKIVGNPTLDGDYYLQLELKGFEVIEKYKGWNNYKRQVIDYESSIEKAKKLSTKYWWVTIVLSLFAIGISIFAIFK